MKKLKVFALALVAAFGFSACDTEEDGATYKEATIVMGGSASLNGSFYTFDKGVQTKTGLGDVATNVIFCFQTIDGAFQFISGTKATNTIVNSQASETKFAEIGSAKASKFEKLTDADFTSTSINIDSKLEEGKNAVAFSNAKCKGFFEVVNYVAESQDLTIKIWIQE